MKRAIRISLGFAALLALATTLSLTRRATAVTAADNYAVDPVHSCVVFRIKHLNCSNFYGRFNQVTGSFSLDADNPGNSKISVEVAASSIDTNNDARDKHLKSPEFFDVDKHAEIKFVSSGFKKAGDNKYDVEGDLTLHGVTKKITAPIEWVGNGKGMQGEARGGLEAVFTVKRSDFGITTMPQMLGDEVRLMVSLEGVKK